MRIGLVDVDGHNFPNFALMKISAYHKAKGDAVEWALPLFGHYDRIYKSKVFTFTPDDVAIYDCADIRKGGTGYDIKSRLPEEIENDRRLDYTLYPQYNFSVQFFSRGCIRRCPFCLVHEKEGGVKPVTPHELNPRGEWVEVLDNNFFANPEWPAAVDYLLRVGKPIKLHGVDIRIMNEEQALALKSLKHYKRPHIAWDLPAVDLRPQLETLAKYMNPQAITCYVLIGFNSTAEEDIMRVRALKEIGYNPFVQPYRDFKNEKKRTWYEVDFARWCNNKFFFKSSDFADFQPRKGFRCGAYYDHPELRTLIFDKKCQPKI